MTKELVLIRHAESYGNKIGILQGRFETNLTIHGMDQARMLKEMLDFEEYDAVYCSPSIRAMQTAAIASNIEIEVLTGLNEMDMGIFEGLCKNELSESDQFKFKQFKTTDNYLEHGGESISVFNVRTILTLNKITKLMGEYKQNRVLIFTHSGWIRSVLHSHLQLIERDEQIAHCQTISLIYDNDLCYINPEKKMKPLLKTSF